MLLRPFICASFQASGGHLILHHGHRFTAFPGLESSIWKFDARARCYVEQCTDPNCRALAP